jgi:hypothetical protein
MGTQYAARNNHDAAWQNAWRIQLADVRQVFRVRAGSTVRRDTMNESSNGMNVTPDGLSAVSADELNGVSGGLADLYESVLDTSSMQAFYGSIASWGRELARISRG